jgi:hypothetical protein
MKPSFLEHPRIIHILIMLGFVALGLLALGAVAVPLWKYYHSNSLMAEPVAERADVPSGALGGGGARCSGPDRLPCMPGTICSVAGADWGVKFGTCEPDPNDKPSSPPSR